MGRDKKRYFNWLNLTRLEDWESWFTDMSSKGLELESIGKYFITFMKKSEGNNRYRIDIFNSDDESAPDRTELYKEAGWEHVASYSMLHVFRSSGNARIPEIHTDPAEFAVNMEKLRKKLTGSSIILFVFAIFIAAIEVMGFSRFTWLTDKFATIGAAFIFFGLFMVFFLQFKSLRSFHRQIKRLKSGGSLNHKSEYKKRMIYSKSLSVFVAALTIAWQAFFIETRFEPHNKYAPIPKGTLPVSSLADFLPQQSINAMLDSDENGYLLNNYQDDWSLLVPGQHELTEFVGKPYYSILESKEYKTITPGVAHLLFNALLDDTQDHSILSKVSSEVFNELWCSAPRYTFDFTIMIAWKGSSVFYLKTNVAVPQEAIVKVFENKER